MRNLVEHPITVEECLSTLDHALMVADDDDRVGSIEGAALEHVISYLRAREEDFKFYLEMVGP